MPMFPTNQPIKWSKFPSDQPIKRSKFDPSDPEIKRLRCLIIKDIKWSNVREDEKMKIKRLRNQINRLAEVKLFQVINNKKTRKFQEVK